jgi:glutaconate CoA-transferase subunit B
LIEVAFLGAAQIDRYGNLNSTVIGEYARPKTRLPGSGGACEIALLARRVLIIARQDARTFVERLDFQTSPGHLTGGESRAGLGNFGRGPETVITDMGIFHFDKASKEMVLSSLHLGCTVDAVQKRVDWPLKVAHELTFTSAPTAHELHIIREDLNPQGKYQ